MRKILTPNRSWLIHNMYEKSAAKAQDDNITPGTAYLFGFEDAIAYANTILETPQEHKRPFLSDEEISSGSLDFYNNNAPTPTAGQIAAWKTAAKWARDRYEEMLSASGDEMVEEWRPKQGDKCAFWLDGDEGTPDICRDFSEYEIFDTDTKKYKTYYGFYYDHCALLESLDEIGKPPSYFINRGRCTVSK